jgi:hypothetical protein
VRREFTPFHRCRNQRTLGHRWLPRQQSRVDIPLFTFSVDNIRTDNRPEGCRIATALIFAETLLTNDTGLQLAALQRIEAGRPKLQDRFVARIGVPIKFLHVPRSESRLIAGG